MGANEVEKANQTENGTTESASKAKAIPAPDSELGI